MNHDLPSPRQRLYELLEVLRPDFEEWDGIIHGDGWLDEGGSLSAQQAGRLKGEDWRKEARRELAELLENHPYFIDVDMLDTWDGIVETDDLLGDAIQDVAVPKHLKQQVLTAVRSKTLS